MIKIEKVHIFGWEGAINGMRNPMNSWHKSDTNWARYYSTNNSFCNDFIGENDLALMKKLSKAGNDHGKFLRMIHVQMDVTAPLYLWKEIDQYKVGTVTNSCSTMHKIHAKEFTLDDFSWEHLYPSPRAALDGTIEELNYWRKVYLDTHDKEDWWQMIQLLPSSYNQKRTLDLNYAALKAMYHARKGHKLDEWQQFCAWVETLPYAQELIVDA